MPSACRIVLSQRFMDDVSDTNSTRIALRARKQIEQLAMFPDMGRHAQSPSLVNRFGRDMRTLVCSSYLIVYRHADDAVEVLALWPARLVR